MHEWVELLAALHEIAENANQVSTNGAADAAVVHLEYLFFCPDDQLLIALPFAM
jgi:hypothetical protein